MEEKVGELLRARLHSALDHDTFDVDIFMAGERSEVVYRVAPDESSAASIADADTVNVTEQLQQHCAEQQREVLEFLTGFANENNFADAEGTVAVPKVSTLQSFWINNAIGAEVTLDVLN